MAAPDIDLKLFTNISTSVVKTGQRTTLYASGNDKALQASRKFNGFVRLGDVAGGIAIFNGGDSIDASTVGDDILSHSYFGGPTILSDLYALIVQGSPPAKRFGLLAKGSPPDIYWELRPR